jgi:hypothetical protein
LLGAIALLGLTPDQILSIRENWQFDAAVGKRENLANLRRIVKLAKRSDQRVGADYIQGLFDVFIKLRTSMRDQDLKAYLRAYPAAAFEASQLPPFQSEIVRASADRRAATSAKPTWDPKTDANTAESEWRADKFEAEITDAWPYRYRDQGEWTKEYLMIDKAYKNLRRLTLQVRPMVKILADGIVALADVISVEVEQSSKIVSSFRTSSETTKRSPLLRAAVGGALFGPAGAIVGAGSASSTTTGTTKGKSHTVQGPAVLVIGTLDFDQPVLKVPMPDTQTAELWLHRVQGAVVRATR